MGEKSLFPCQSRNMVDPGPCTVCGMEVWLGSEHSPRVRFSPNRPEVLQLWHERGDVQGGGFYFRRVTCSFDRLSSWFWHVSLFVRYFLTMVFGTVCKTTGSVH